MDLEQLIEEFDSAAGLEQASAEDGVWKFSADGHVFGVTADDSGGNVFNTTQQPTPNHCGNRRQTTMSMTVNLNSAPFKQFVQFAKRRATSVVARACAAAACLLAIAGCGMDSVELGEYVKKEMQAELVKVDGLKSLQMKEVRLLQDDDVNYSGIGKGEIGGRTVKFDVKCKYDGKTVLWEALPADDSMFSLATREKAQEIYGKVKDGLKKAYDAASKKAGELYESATKGTGKCSDSVKETTTSE